MALAPGAQERCYIVSTSTVLLRLRYFDSGPAPTGVQRSLTVSL
jgi:hypothetical protein